MKLSDLSRAHATANLRDFLEQTKGKGFAILSRSDTNAIREGVMHSPSGQRRSITHNSVRVRIFTLDEILHNDKALTKTLKAFHAGLLGVTRDMRHTTYAFNQTTSDALKKAHIRTINVTNLPSKGAETFPSAPEDENMFDTISEDVYAKILAQISSDADLESGLEIEKEPESESEEPLNVDLTWKTDAIKTTKRITSLKPMVEATKKSSNRTEMSEESHEKAIKEDDRRLAALEKDELAAEKKRYIIKSDRLKADNLQAETKQNLVNIHELNEADLNQMLNNGEINEAAMNALLNSAYIDESSLNYMLKHKTIDENAYNKLMNAIYETK